MKDRLHWFAMHGVIRCGATIGKRRGDMHARLIADPAVAANPVPFYEEVRSRGPLVRNRVTYMTADHQLAHELLRSDDFRVISYGERLPAPLAWLERHTRDHQLHPLLAPSLLAVEPPDHTRYRKTVSAVFTSRAVTALRDRVEQTAISILDRLAEQSGVVDVVGRYCSQLPIAVISDMLGVPDHDRRRVLEFGELAAPSLDMGLPWQQYARVQRGIVGFNAWLVAHLEQLRRAPGDDLMSQLIRTTQSGDAQTYLDDDELRAVAGLVLVAGFETTVNLLGNGIRLLLDNPEQLELLSRQPELWTNAVEEILRLDSPVQLTARVARNDVEVAGTRLTSGAVVVIYLAAANRDPSVFVDPHRFDIQRANAGKHLAFSTGRHFCLGAALARAEGEVGLRTFFERFPEVRAAGLGTRRDTRVLRGWSTLPVNLGRARSMATS
ncbi:cytochrome P450 [Mycobacterium spongiae]|uniref:Cytochrome P450 n=1 Tax=Mycobacterium spongiae TaxID=886343 RepID=A0A975JXQ9_9MYCO|nr:cytochrome P450 [Mycobacterium spongiae]QUR67636.1 cytochrome P450 [Mycobacterium spongiae]